MSETIPKETHPKMVRRNIAVALAIICIVLIASLGGAIAYYYISIASTLSDKDNTISSLNSQIENFHSQIRQYQTDLNGNKTLLSQTQTWLNGNVTQSTNLQKIVNLQELTLLYADRVAVPNSHGYAVYRNIPAVAPDLQNIIGEGPWIPIKYAGYLVVVIVLSAGNTSVQVDYSSNQFHYSNTVNTGSTGMAYFPILPTTDLNIKLFNTDLVNLYITMVTITYYY